MLKCSGNIAHAAERRVEGVHVFEEHEHGPFEFQLVDEQGFLGADFALVDALPGAGSGMDPHVYLLCGAVRDALRQAIAHVQIDVGKRRIQPAIFNEGGKALE